MRGGRGRRRTTTWTYRQKMVASEVAKTTLKHKVLCLLVSLAPNLSRSGQPFWHDEDVDLKEVEVNRKMETKRQMRSVEMMDGGH